MQKGFRTLLVRLGKLRVRKNFLRRRVFLRNLHIYNQSQTRGRTFLTFEGKFSAGCSKLHSRCQGEKFEEKLFLLKKNQFKKCFRTMEKKFRKMREFFQHGSHQHNCILHMQRNLLRKNVSTRKLNNFSIAFRLWTNHFQRLGKKVQAAFQNCILGVERNIPRKRSYIEEIIEEINKDFLY